MSSGKSSQNLITILINKYKKFITEIIKLMQK